MWSHRESSTFWWRWCGSVKRSIIGRHGDEREKNDDSSRGKNFVCILLLFPHRQERKKSVLLIASYLFFFSFFICCCVNLFEKKKKKKNRDGCFYSWWSRSTPKESKHTHSPAEKTDEETLLSVPPRGMTSQNKRSRSIVRDKPSLFTIFSHSLTKNSICLFCCYYQQHNKINQINFIFYLYVFYPDYHRLTPFNIVFCFHHDHLHPSTSSFTLMGFLFLFSIFVEQRGKCGWKWLTDGIAQHFGK